MSLFTLLVAAFLSVVILMWLFTGCCQPHVLVYTHTKLLPQTVASGANELSRVICMVLKTLHHAESTLALKNPLRTVKAVTYFYCLEP